MKKWITCCFAGTLLLAATVTAEHQYQKIAVKPAVSNQALKPVNQWEQPDKKALEDCGLGYFETSLPVLLIDTQHRQITKENKIQASLAVLNQREDGQPRSILETPDVQFPITIKYRGASSYSQFDKKQYRIEFYEKKEHGKRLDYAFLGMGADSEWVLNGPFLDKTLMRNRLIYSLGREIFEWAPDSRYAEVFLDGEYQGVYLAVEPVTNGASRLRLSEFGLLSGETPYIVKRDRVGTEENPLQTYGKTEGKTSNDLYISYPSASRITERQKEWIEQDISKFEQILYSDYFADPQIGYARYIDEKSFADYVVLNEAVMNQDAGNLSTYIYQELGGEMQMTIWDYNNCYDNYQWFSQDFTRFFTDDKAWFGRLLQDRAFVDRVVSRYYELRSSTLSTEHIYERIEQLEQELGEAKERNFAVWGYSFYENMLARSDENANPDSCSAAMTQLKEAIEQRFAFLDAHIEDLYKNCIN